MGGYRSWERRSRTTQAIIVVILAAAAYYFIGPRDVPFIGDDNGAAASDDSAPVPPATLVVTRVVDGDTLRLSDGRRVRLAQIDSPEVSEGECYSTESTAALARITVPGRTIVRLETDPVVGQKDRFGRSLGYVLAGSRNVNLELVRAGAASVWYFEGQRGRYAAELMQAAREARASHAGLWAACPRAKLDPTRGVSTG